ncbi:MAG: hypothetical protein JO314_07310 [Acidobacteria bacterium]|nr:hypothetical protein [Acidobacteriota bacterium]
MPKKRNAYKVEINVGDYLGHYGLVEFGGDVVAPDAAGSRTFDLEPGSYVVDNMNRVEHSMFAFTVGLDGRVGKIEPAGAATQTSNGLVFSTAKIKLDPGKYEGAYYLPAFPSIGAKLGRQPALIKCLIYRVDAGSRVGGSDFGFYVNEKGDAESLSRSATDRDGGIKFNTVRMRIARKDKTGSFRIAGFNKDQPGTGVTVQLIPMVVIRVLCNGQDLWFTLSPKGTLLYGTAGGDLDILPE